MTSDTFNNQSIRCFLENAIQHVESVQTQVTTIEDRLQEIKSQIDLSLEAIDTVLKQAEVNERNSEKVRSDVAATLGEMFEQMTSIVNGARDQMLQPQEGVSAGQTIEEIPSDTGIPTETVPKIATTAQAPSESLTASQVGQRASESLREMIATINDEEIAPLEQERLEETVATNQTPSDTQANEEAEEVPTCAGSKNSLSELLVKAKAATDETEHDGSELMPYDGEDDPQAVSELLKNTSGSVIVKN